jgi:tRNA (guanine10-N2)-dimethyltransferase
MTYLYRLAGENLELAEAELKGFLNSQAVGDEVERSGRLAWSSSHPNQLKRLALTHEVCRKTAETEIENIEIDFNIEKSFAVRCKVLKGDADSRKVEEKLGEEIKSSKNSVDLENPDKQIYAYVIEEKIILGEMIQDIDRGLFKERSNEKRPFSSPVSLSPVLARVLVNLAEVPAGGKILDPFCGTSGILVEAGLCGILPLGTDIEQEMVKGSRENLEEYGIINHEIKQKDASESLNLFQHNIDAIVTDLPYGKASKIEGEIENKFSDLVRKYGNKVVFMYDKPRLGELSSDFKVYVHKNLTRHVFVVD